MLLVRGIVQRYAQALCRHMNTHIEPHGSNPIVSGVSDARDLPALYEL
jgi:hypothetical protein